MNDRGERLHYLAFIELLQLIDQHISSGEQPILTESERPYHARQWVGNLPITSSRQQRDEEAEDQIISWEGYASEDAELA